LDREGTAMSWKNASVVLLITIIISTIYFYNEYNSIFREGDCVRLEGGDLRIYEIKEGMVVFEVCSPRKCMFKTVTHENIQEYLQQNFQKIYCPKE
jgi:hypothetical protein